MVISRLSTGGLPSGAARAGGHPLAVAWLMVGEFIGDDPEMWGTRPGKHRKNYGYHRKTIGKWWFYPLVNIQKTMERSTIFHGKTHDFNGDFP